MSVNKLVDGEGKIIILIISNYNCNEKTEDVFGSRLTRIGLEAVRMKYFNREQSRLSSADFFSEELN